MLIFQGVDYFEIEHKTFWVGGVIPLKLTVYPNIGQGRTHNDTYSLISEQFWQTP